MSSKYKIGTATIERWYHDFLHLKIQESKHAHCPKVMGIDEHFFSRKKGYVTTICNLYKNKVFYQKIYFYLSCLTKLLMTMQINLL